MTKMTLQALHTLVADDAFAGTFQSVSQYRGALLRAFDYLIANPAQPCPTAPNVDAKAGDGGSNA